MTWLTGVWARMQAAARAVVLVMGAVVALLVTARRDGRRSAEREALHARINGAAQRERAEVDAARAADPAAELRRDWLRGVAPDAGVGRGSPDR